MGLRRGAGPGVGRLAPDVRRAPARAVPRPGRPNWRPGGQPLRCPVRIEPCAPLGRFAPEVEAVATKANQSLGAQVAFVVTNTAGGRASCT